MRDFQNVMPATKKISCVAPEACPALSLRDVSFSFSSRRNLALKNISLDISHGEFVVITGLSGCGKSTLAAAMSGHIPHVIPGSLSGEIYIDGISTGTADLPSLAVQSSLCQQDPESQLCTLSVCEEVCFGPENLVLPVQEVERRMQSALAAVDAIHLKSRSISGLSGGEKQRVAIASMLAMQPGILILDEPTSSLDPDSADEVFSAIARLRREREITVIVIEHRFNRLLQMADRMIVMESGAIAMDGNPGEVYGRYQKTLAEVKNSRLRMPCPKANHSLGNDEAIHLRNLRFSYKDKEVLHDVSLSACKGEIIGIIGPNGSGKTTFLNCLAGLCRPSSGVIRINGIDAGNIRVSEMARHLGFVFQNPNHQIFKNTVFDEIVFACNNFGISREVSDRLVTRIMDDYGISSYSRRSPLTLSHGEKRRLNVCSILPHDPCILILDEPFIGQDMVNTAIITEDIQRLAGAGKTFLIVSHDMDWVFRHCDRVVFFEEGSIVTDDIPSKAIGRIRDIGAINFLPGGYGNDHQVC